MIEKFLAHPLCATVREGGDYAPRRSIQSCRPCCPTGRQSTPRTPSTMSDVCKCAGERACSSGQAGHAREPVTPSRLSLPGKS